MHERLRDKDPTPDFLAAWAISPERTFIAALAVLALPCAAGALRHGRPRVPPVEPRGRVLLRPGRRRAAVPQRGAIAAVGSAAADMRLPQQ